MILYLLLQGLDGFFPPFVCWLYSVSRIIIGNVVFVASWLFTLSFRNDAYHPYTCVRGMLWYHVDFSLRIPLVLFLLSEAKVYFESS